MSQPESHLLDAEAALEAEEPLAAGEDALEGQAGARLELQGNLREKATRGVLVNAGFQAGYAILNVLQRFVVAAFLTTVEFGIWGLVLTTLITLSFLKQVGISDKYIQQDDADQEVAFQKAFTLELIYTLALSAAIAILMPLYALLYDRPEMLAPSLVLTLALLGSALCAPLWVPFRRMQFVRQRLLEGINPVISTVVMVSLAIAGAGYWALIAGMLAGVYSAAVVAWITCPYALRLRFDRGTLREYVRFSWPVLLASGSGLLVVQGTMLVANYSVGLAGVGAIALAGSLLVFAQRVDALVSRTIYPAVCAVKDRTELLFETFVKSNRIALMWGLPFGFGLLLFSPALVEFVLGEQWEPAVALLQTLGLIVGFGQLGFNWTIFFQATGDTRPLAVSGVITLIGFLVTTVPLMIAFGLDGYIAGSAIGLLIQLATRTYYLRRMFPRFNPARHVLRAIAPCVPPVLAVVAMRLAFGAPEDLAVAAAEFAVFVALTVASTAFAERRLLGELIGYIRGRSDTSPLNPGEPAVAA
jgi:PST family polysaccharide transporter